MLCYYVADRVGDVACVDVIVVVVVASAVAYVDVDVDVVSDDALVLVLVSESDFPSPRGHIGLASSMRWVRVKLA